MLDAIYAKERITVDNEENKAKIEEIEKLRREKKQIEKAEEDAEETLAKKVKMNDEIMGILKRVRENIEENVIVAFRKSKDERCVIIYGALVGIYRDLEIITGDVLRTTQTMKARQIMFGERK